MRAESLLFLYHIVIHDDYEVTIKCIKYIASKVHIFVKPEDYSFKLEINILQESNI